MIVRRIENNFVNSTESLINCRRVLYLYSRRICSIPVTSDDRTGKPATVYTVFSRRRRRTDDLRSRRILRPIPRARNDCRVPAKRYGRTAWWMCRRVVGARRSRRSSSYGSHQTKTFVEPATRTNARAELSFPYKRVQTCVRVTRGVCTVKKNNNKAL